MWFEIERVNADGSTQLLLLFPRQTQRGKGKSGGVGHLFYVLNPPASKHTEVSMGETFPGGAIIIGSLLWQDDLNQERRDRIRLQWRQGHLRENTKALVRLPIRYGRHSTRNIYTMVFSTECAADERLGTGYVVPFRATVDVSGLIAAAREMASAEGMDRRFFKDWGSMTILLNQDALDCYQEQVILAEWEPEFKADGGGKDVLEYRVGSERPSITKRGELSIRWPKPVDVQDRDSVDRFGFLIASSTKPRYEQRHLRQYPPPNDIARSVLADTRRQYFRNNRAHQITTFQDDLVLTALPS